MKNLSHDITSPESDNNDGKMPQIALPPYASDLIDLLENAEYEAWCVGGFVRDALLNHVDNDVDIATDAPWQDVQKLCEDAGLHTHETGVKHGTLTVVFPDHDNATIEVTTYRADGNYGDSRHPDSVSFVHSIEEDLARRDFTINALAYHPTRGILDPYNGVADLRKGIIRTVGEPKKRFSEDALRILRACRFVSQLGFSLDSEVYDAMVSKKSLLRKVSVERITDELDRFLLGTYVFDALMSCVDVLSFAVPELVAMKGCEQKTKYHIYDVLEHTAHVIEHTPPQRVVRWAALCHDMGKPAAAFFDEKGVEHFYGHAHISCTLARGLLGRLNMSRSFRNKVYTLVKYHDETVDPTPRSVKRALAWLDSDTDLFLSLCDIKKADALSQAPFCADRAVLADELKEILSEVLANNEAFSVKDLAINGNDLKAQGIEAGSAIGQLLTRALEAVIAEKVPNEKDALLDYVLSGTS